MPKVEPPNGKVWPEIDGFAERDNRPVIPVCPRRNQATAKLDQMRFRPPFLLGRRFRGISQRHGFKLSGGTQLRPSIISPRKWAPHCCRLCLPPCGTMLSRHGEAAGAPCHRSTPTERGCGFFLTEAGLF